MARLAGMFGAKAGKGNKTNEEKFKSLLDGLTKRKVTNLHRKLEGNFVTMTSHLLEKNNINNIWDSSEGKTYNDILFIKIYEHFNS